MPIQANPRLLIFLVLGSVIAPLLVGLHAPLAQNASTTNQPTFYRDVLPILQRHCQSCHREGEIAPMPLVTYEHTRPWAKAIAGATRAKKMPPWFADPCCGRFADDPSLTAEQIEALSAWADA